MMDIDISNKLHEIESKIDKLNEEKEQEELIYKIFNGKMVFILSAIVAILFLFLVFPNVLHKDEVKLLQRDFDKCEFKYELFTPHETYYCYKDNYTITEIQCIDTYCRINGYLYQRLKE